MKNQKIPDTDIGRTMTGIVKKTGHRVLAVWASDCASGGLLRRPLGRPRHRHGPCENALDSGGLVRGKGPWARVPEKGTKNA